MRSENEIFFKKHWEMKFKSSADPGEEKPETKRQAVENGNPFRPKNPPKTPELRSNNKEPNPTRRKQMRNKIHKFQQNKTDKYKMKSFRDPKTQISQQKSTPKSRCNSTTKPWLKKTPQNFLKNYIFFKEKTNPNPKAPTQKKKKTMGETKPYNFQTRPSK